MHFITKKPSQSTFFSTLCFSPKLSLPVKARDVIVAAENYVFAYLKESPHNSKGHCEFVKVIIKKIEPRV